MILLGNFYFGTKRDEYRQGYTHEALDDFGDYGLGVVYDSNSNNTDCIYFHYDREQKKSLVTNKVKQNLLKDISEIDWKADSNVQEVKKHAYKPNPILGTNTEENEKLIKGLMFKYKIAAMLQGLKKNKIGRELFDF